MKIIQIGSFPSDESFIRGGVEASIYGVSVELSKNHEVIVFDLPKFEVENDYSEMVSSILVYRFHNPKRNNRHAVLRVNDMVREIEKLKPDVIHIHGTNRIENSLFKALQIKSFKVGLTVHGLGHIEMSNALRKRKTFTNLIRFFYFSLIEFRLLMRAQSIIVDTEYVRIAIDEYHKKKKILSLPNMHVIPQGIDPVYFSLGKPDLKNNRLLCIGGINERKAQLLLLEAFKIAKISNPHLKLFIAGFKSSETYYHKLLQFIKENRFESDVEIKTNLSKVEILELYESVSAFVLHSHEESQGIVFCEAMAAGLPVVATNVGGVPYVVVDSINGYLSDYGDVDTFAQNILELTSNSQTMSEMSKRNVEDAKQYNWVTIAEKVIEYYKTL